MKLARFRTADGQDHVGRVDTDRLVDLTGTAGIGSSVTAILPDLETLRPAIETADGREYDFGEVTLLPPVDAPQKFLGIGMNYRAHAAEALQAGIPTPTSQLWFNKQVSCIVGPHDDIEKPRVSDEMDYEIELGVVIGKRCRHVAAADARSVIAGYVVVNDVSVRDWLAKRSPTFTLGKSFDTHGPIGPWLTTDDEIADPLDLGLRLWVNGEERQNARTNDMIYDVYEQIEYLTTVMTLMPGDVLATGTPSGIGAPTRNFLRVGDVVRGEVDGLGVIENTVVAEP
ncbi:2-keto-4-pentenoate hydratase/2-oxohepta-3-ene-1,7-dioic acid hydratase in catechol pathway [Curtobacterium pusillum]|uniref:2-keto-4-pentenoate hydratase/2-oxohepta-3-ene-1,7-dioic acid hydratase in catechol pathway n=1 Tax=Curtobacterium pusillum TaxID=69373 RepID=A0AAW3T904_9MICO|nr:fumarylacetoacetate hydrolase family protein [Curtobacterium pusillum]MBA8991150.1 2-keto-4-pentenoate hydratase/2-oxohepta-3-ene-1,7-dioic acid hydratase in catechol pathway [Curtobacterium pusillum]